MATQTTIGSPVRFSHRGLWSGRAASVRLVPAPADSGIVFNGTVPARIANATVEAHTVRLSRGTDSVLGVEHLLAACYGLGIDNLGVEVSNGEVPFGDGSALPFVRILQAAGLKRLPDQRSIQVALRPVTVFRGPAFICALPSEEPGGDARSGLDLSYFIQYEAPEIGEQFCNCLLSRPRFMNDFAGARTFGCWPADRPLPAWLGSVRVSGGNLVLPARERFDNEPVRHKVLDLVGDLALLGRRLAGQILAYRAGHDLHHELLRRMEEEWTSTQSGK